CPVLVLRALLFFSLAGSLNTRATGSHVPQKSLKSVHANSAPDTAQAVTGFPLNSSWSKSALHF
ncbi:hypothetical protein, partial [Endozoicomonas sp. YOMI1]|uniref:hypothetical protein n=1 Tax=Endozoicomonas sp. YOMI1 TaxID=2828739 RepID=UPI00214919AC